MEWKMKDLGEKLDILLGRIDFEIKRKIHPSKIRQHSGETVTIVTSFEVSDVQQVAPVSSFENHSPDNSGRAHFIFRNAKYDDMIFFHAGKVDVGESPEMGGIREFEEEWGFKLKPEEITPVHRYKKCYYHIFPYSKRTKHKIKYTENHVYQLLCTSSPGWRRECIKHLTTENDRIEEHYDGKWVTTRFLTEHVLPNENISETIKELHSHYLPPNRRPQPIKRVYRK